MTTLDGHGTPLITKTGLETSLYGNSGIVDEVGYYACSSAGSGTWHASSDYALPDAGEDLVVRARSKILSTTDMVVTITGTDADDAELTGAATIAAGVPEDTSYSVVPSVTGKVFKTITTITATGGLAGDGFDVSVLPDDGDDTLIKFHQGVDTGAASAVKAIFQHWELDHNKRTRGDRSLSISDLHTTHTSGMSYFTGADVTLRVDVNDDGRDQATTVVYLAKCRLYPKRTFPGNDSEDSVTDAFEGTYGKIYNFS